MNKVVVVNLEKVDFHTMFDRVELIESLDMINKRSETYVIDSTNVNVGEISVENTNLFIPAKSIEQMKLLDDVYVYFELELYPFYKKAKDLILKNQKPKGVFRFRRILGNDVNEAVIADDLFVISSLLGDPEDVHLKRTNRTVLPYHVILLVNFGGGTMAHLEYTFSNEKELIEFEWSGVKQIIEFHSGEMNPVKPKRSTALPLMYNIDSIVSGSHKVDEMLLSRLEKYSQLLERGANE